MNELTDMVMAAKDGKISDFESSFGSIMANKVLDAVDNVRAEVGSSVKIDGEQPLEVPNGE